MAFVMVLAGPGRAAPFELGGADWEGCADFLKLARSEVGTERVIAATKLDWTALRPGDSIFLLYPLKPVDYLSVGAFVRAGGHVVLLDDFGAGDDLLSSFDIRRVPLPAHPLAGLRGNPELAIAEPSWPDYPLTEHVDHLVTNHATGLEQPLMRRVLEVRGTGGVSVPLALAATFGPGKLIAVGDPSIVINAMLRYPGNREFARNLIRDAAAGPRGGHIYFVSGAFSESGSFARATDPISEWLGSLRHAAASMRGDVLPGWMLYWFSFVVTLVIMAWLIPTAARTYKAAAPRFTRPIPVVMQGGTAGHAAVLAAKGASRGLALLEWKAALEEELAFRLGLARTPSADELLRRIRVAGWVNADEARSLSRLLLRMAEVETMFLAHRTDALRGIRDQEVLAAHAVAMRVLSAARGSQKQAIRPPVSGRPPGHAA